MVHMNGKLIPYTLFEGDYHLGGGAWLNSLYASGFRGEACVGFRGDLPPWASSAKAHLDERVLEVSSDFVVRFIPYDPPFHFTFCKASFARRLLDNSDCSGIAYFDPDIVVLYPWTFFENWIKKGIALCEDSNLSPMPENHPYRFDWIDYARKVGHNVQRPLTQYLNAGFVGVAFENRKILDIWDDLIRNLPGVGIALDRAQQGDRSSPFFRTDQDMLNLAVMTSGLPLSTIGTEGMGFKNSGFSAMAHAVGVKPWKKRYIHSALHAMPPCFAEKAFWSFAKEPIRIYSDPFLKRMRLQLALAAGIGRFYSHC
jgi:hypothetical protein